MFNMCGVLLNYYFVYSVHCERKRDGRSPITTNPLPTKPPFFLSFFFFFLFFCCSISTARRLFFFYLVRSQNTVKGSTCQLLAQTECRRLNRFYECGVYLQSAPMRFHTKPMKIFKLLFFIRPFGLKALEPTGLVLLSFFFISLFVNERVCLYFRRIRFIFLFFLLAQFQ